MSPVVVADMLRTPLLQLSTGEDARPTGQLNADHVGPPTFVHLRPDMVDLPAAPIDSGFETPTPFDQGQVVLWDGDEALLNQSQPRPFMNKLCSSVAAVLLGASGIGCLYLALKTRLIRKDEIGLTEANDGSIRVLTPGWHLIECINTRVARFRVQQDVITHGVMTIVRIPPGRLGIGSLNGSPVFLRAGRHVVNDPLFSYERTVNLTEPHITAGTSHIITVSTDSVGLCTVNGRPHMLEPGIHRFNNPQFHFERFARSSDEHISIGSKHRILVAAGRVGLAFEGGAPQVLDPGQLYNIESPTFRYVGSRDVTAELISHGSIQIVIVQQGRFGIAYDDGQLTVLQPGRHVLDKPTHFFADFLSSGQETLSIEAVTSMSSDNVGLRFDAAVTVQVTDAHKAVTMLTGEGPFSATKVYRNIVDKAKLALSIIIGNNRMNSSFRSSTYGSKHRRPIMSMASIAEPEADSDPVEVESDTSFKQHIHDVFMTSFADSMAHDCGVHIIDMSVEDITITNPELASAMAKGAVARTELDKAKVDLEVSRTRADAKSQSDITLARGQAEAMRIIADSEASRIKKLDEAMSSVCSVTQERELIRAAGEALSGANATVVLSQSVPDLGSLFGRGSGGLTQQLVSSRK